jgi:hypothetical protein
MLTVDAVAKISDTVLYIDPRKNQYGGQIVVIKAKNDLGEDGWMICEFVQDEKRGNRFYPKLWYTIDTQVTQLIKEVDAVAEFEDYK